MKNGRWSKTWSQRIRINGELVQRGLGKGSYPLVSLAMARDVVRDNAPYGSPRVRTYDSRRERFRPLPRRSMSR